MEPLAAEYPTVFDVRAFGPRGDGRGKATRELQQAIDACAEAGGGTVLVPAGRYVTGTLFLRSHVELHLRAGAELLGSWDREDYNADDVFPENHCFAFEHVSGGHLIVAYEQRNVSITGQGTIDGRSSGFFEGLPPVPEGGVGYRVKRRRVPPAEWRPGQMLFFCKCRDVAVRDVALLNSPYWGLFCLGCDRVKIRGLTVINPPETPNGDGIDIDCCRDVTVSDCIVHGGDDCITLRGNTRALGIDKACENVVVSNCVLSTPCNAIRVGVGPGTVRNCVLDNIVITDTRTAVNMVSRYSERLPQGTTIENISFANFRVDAILPLQCIAGAGAVAPSGIRDVCFAHFRVSAEAGSYVGGNPGCEIERIRFHDWDLHVRGGTDNCELAERVPHPFPVAGMPGLQGRPALPAALYATFARDVIVDGMRVRWSDIGRVWRHALWLEHVRDVRIRNSRTPAPRADGDLPGIRCEDVEESAAGPR